MKHIGENVNNSHHNKVGVEKNVTIIRNLIRHRLFYWPKNKGNIVGQLRHIKDKVMLV